MKKLQYLKVVLICALPILYYHLFYMIRYARHPEKYPFERRYAVARKEIRMVLKHFHVDIKAEGMDKFISLNEKCLIISNHLSFLDPLLLIALSEKPITFVAKQEAFKYPFVNKVAKALEIFPLDRHNIMNQISEIRSVVNYLKDQNKPSVVIYIEGTRNKHPENHCLDFHAGTLKISQMAHVPLIVTSTFGSFRILDFKSYVKPYPTFVKMSEIIDRDTMKQYNTSELATLLKQKIDDEVDNFRRLDKEIILKSKISNKRKELEIKVDACVNS